MVRVASVPLPLFRTFTYRVPEEMAGSGRRGSRVLVPFGRRETDRLGGGGRCGGGGRMGSAIWRGAGHRAERPRRADASSAAGSASTTWRRSGRFSAPPSPPCSPAAPATPSRCSRGETARGSHPAREAADGVAAGARGAAAGVSLRRELGERSWWPAIHALVGPAAAASPNLRRTAPAVRRAAWSGSAELATLMEREKASSGRAGRQRECWEVLESLGGAPSCAHLTGQLGFSSTVVRGLVEKGLVESRDEEMSRDPYAAIESARRPR
jgi:hypothetical protein